VELLHPATRQQKLIPLFINESLGVTTSTAPAHRAMSRRLVSSGSSFEEQIAYSRAVVQDDWVFVSGTTGFDYSNMTISPNLEDQTRQCLENIASALQGAGASLQDVVRVRYILPNGEDFEKCWPILREYFGSIRPAATMLTARLLDPRMLIEIEVTAFRQQQTKTGDA
jgi:enamine deaminase RidA (YjgF/YER057c/UK114 family)